MLNEAAVQERSSTPGVTERLLDIATIRTDFPILQNTVRGKPLVYLDNAATTSAAAFPSSHTRVVLVNTQPEAGSHLSSVHWLPSRSLCRLRFRLRLVL